MIFIIMVINIIKNIIITIIIIIFVIIIFENLIFLRKKFEISQKFLNPRIPRTKG